MTKGRRERERKGDEKEKWRNDVMESWGKRRRLWGKTT